MSDEGFLRRWSRRKLAETPSPAADAESAATLPSQPSAAARGKGSLEGLPPRGGERLDQGDSATAATKSEDDAIDPTTLPPLESLGPDSDYSVFLRKGVPEALRLAALRKAWTSDPFIRDFRSPAIDYGWDFTTPDYALRPGDNVAKLLDQIYSPGGGEPAQPEVASSAEVREPQPAPSAATVPAPPVPVSQIEAAPPVGRPEPLTESRPRVLRRKHGGALPGKPD